MAYLVDTDSLIDMYSDQQVALELLERLAASGIAISIISYMEVYEGILRSRTPEQVERKLDALLETIPLVPLSLRIAQRCARLRKALRQEGKRVNQRALDLIIAATAIEHGLDLVTRNADDYKDVPGLRLY